MTSTEQPRRSAGRMIARNTLFGLGAQFALRVASFIFTILVIRTLGGEAFGQYSIVLAWASLFSVIGDLGINQYLAREIARDPKKADELFWDTVALRFVLALIASIITTAGAALNGYSGNIVLGVVIYTGSYFLQAVLAPLGSLLTGNERVDIMSTMSVVTQILFMIFAGLFLYLGLNFIWVVIASVINLPIVIVLQYLAIRRNHLGPPRFHLNPSLWWFVIKHGLPFGVVHLSLSFAFRVDTVLLSGHVSDTQVGWYNAAYNLTLTLLTLTRTFNDAILPTLAREHVYNPNSVRPWYYHSVKVMLLIGLPIAVGGMLTADKLVQILYEPNFAPAALALAILVWDIPVVMYHSFCGNMTTSIKREGSAARIYGSLGIINLLLNLLFIPRFGILGASLATVLTDLAGAAQFYFLFRHEFGAGLGFTRLARIGIGAALMGVLVYLLRDWNFVVITLAAAVFYALFVWLSGAFSLEERTRLVQFVARRLRLRMA
ncbi:MAG: oligosaccharide flippase family protein [Chloroflexi bacterium]|nr:oligosaccharide flippase family protein [Chloroflexota bacterium]